jgi:small-conductance mechanosensitive channel
VIIQPNVNPSHERSAVTASFALDARSGRILIVIIVVITALALHHLGQDLATALLLAAAALGAAGDVAARIIPKETC